MRTDSNLNFTDRLSNPRDRVQPSELHVPRRGGCHFRADASRPPERLRLARVDPQKFTGSGRRGSRFDGRSRSCSDAATAGQVSQSRDDF